LQCPNFNALTLVSMAAAIMSITYSTIAFGASVAHGPIPDVQYNLDGFSLADGLFGVWNALGTVAFAYGGHNVVLEIQVWPFVTLLAQLLVACMHDCRWQCVCECNLNRFG